MANPPVNGAENLRRRVATHRLPACEARSKRVNLDADIDAPESETVAKKVDELRLDDVAQRRKESVRQCPVRTLRKRFESQVAWS
jgi:hypothetical protein